MKNFRFSWFLFLEKIDSFFNIQLTAQQVTTQRTILFQIAFFFLVFISTRFRYQTTARTHFDHHGRKNDLLRNEKIGTWTKNSIFPIPTNRPHCFDHLFPQRTNGLGTQTSVALIPKAETTKTVCDFFFFFFNKEETQTYFPLYLLIHSQITLQILRNHVNHTGNFQKIFWSCKQTRKLQKYHQNNVHLHVQSSSSNNFSFLQL